MKIKINNIYPGIDKLPDYLYPIIIIFICIISWYPSVNIGYINDDYQIVGYHNPQNFIDCFSPFWSKDVSPHYWRPIPNTFQRLIKFFLGDFPLPFRLMNLVLYSIISYLLWILFIKLKLPKPASLFSILLFATSISHDNNLAWIAGIGDLLMTIFILFQIIFLIEYLTKSNKNYLIFSSFFFLLAVLTKEHAYIAIFFPAIFFLLKDNFNNELHQNNDGNNFINRNNVLFNSIMINILIAIIVLSYRFLIIGGSPLSSPNFSNLDLISIFYNFLLYIPTSLVTPDFLIMFREYKILLYIFSIPLGIILHYIIRAYRFTDKQNKKIFNFGLVWFIIGILPALPLYMRWYNFFPSIGLFILLSVVLDYENRKIKHGLITAFTIAIITTSIGSNINDMHKWVEVSERAHIALESVENIDMSKLKRITLWAVPDKFYQVNAMKTGTQQAIQKFSNNKEIDVYSPLRSICYSNSKIEVIKKDSLNFMVKATNAILLPIFHREKLFSREKDFYIKNEEYELKIKFDNKSSEIKSEALIKFYKIHEKDMNIYFDGRIFKKI